MTRLVDRIFGFDYFISYTWSDAEIFADGLHRVLTEEIEGKHKLRVFLDKNVYHPGDDLRAQTVRRVRSSSILVLVLTPCALESDWVVREVEACLGAKRRVLPLNINRTWEEAPEGNQLIEALSKSGEKDILRMDLNVPTTKAEVLFKGNDAPVIVDRLTEGPSKACVERILGTLAATSVETRRHRIVRATVGSLAVLTLLASVLGWATHRSLAVATEQRDVALGSVQKLIYEVQTKMEDRPGNREIRENILAVALVELEKIEKGLSNSPDLTKRDRQAIESRILDIRIELGKFEEAEEAARRLAEEKSKVLKFGENTPQQYREAIAGNNRLANIYRNTGRDEMALQLYQTNVKYLEGLSEVAPKSVSLEIELGDGDSRLANTLNGLSRPQQALPILQNSVKRYNRLFYAHPTHPDIFRRLGHAYLSLADTYIALEKLIEAGQAYADGLSEIRLFIKDNPNIVSGKLKGSELANGLAKVYQRMRQFQDASPFVEEALRYAKELQESDPNDVNILSNRINVMLTAAEFHSAQGDQLAALDHLREAQSLSATLRKITNESYMSLYHEAYILSGIGHVHMAQKEFSNAIKSNRAAMKSLTKIFKIGRNQDQAVVAYVVNGYQHAVSLLKTGDLVEGRVALKALWNHPEVQRLKEASPTSASFELVKSIAALAELEERHFEVSSAKEHYRMALDLFDKISESRPLKPEESKVQTLCRDSHQRILQSN